MERLLVVSSSPHIHSPLDTQKVMGWVLAALAPAGLAGVYFFGFRAAIVMAVCVASCVLFEYLWEKAVKKPSTVNDLSAAVTGLLLAYNLPPTIPFWMAVLGSLFSMIVVKTSLRRPRLQHREPRARGPRDDADQLARADDDLDDRRGLRPDAARAYQDGRARPAPEPSGPLHRTRRRMHRRDLCDSPSDRLRHPSLEGHNQMAHPRRLRR